MVGVFERVYEIGPVFRAEPHDTARHLAEYVSLDVELGFIDDHRDVMAVLREVLAGMVAEISERAAEDVDLLGVRLPARARPRSRCVHFRRAGAAAASGPTAGEPDLAPEHERRLGEWAQSEHGSDFLFVEGYPAAQAALLHASRARPPRATRTPSTCSSAAWSW